MFRYKNNLKKLPIPKLDNTISEYKKWIKPLLTKEEYKKSQEIITSFSNQDGIGPKLHKYLIEKQEQKSNKSWLISLWNDMYLEYRLPLVINMNYYSIINSDTFKKKLTPHQLTALSIVKATKIYFTIVDKSLHPEKIRDTPLCMEQYKNIFGSTRIPEKIKDKFKIKEEDKNLCHIIFYYKNNMYKIMVTDEKGQIYPIQAIANTIKFITREAIPSDENIGVLTTAPREKAAILYKKICAIKKNKQNYEDICNAVAVFCLDEDTNSEDITETFLCSDGQNRYFDKATQIIITKDNEIGINVEHSSVDATAYLNIINMLYEYIISKTNIFKEESDEKVQFEVLKWSLNEEIKQELNQLLKDHQKHAQSIFTKYFSFEKFGKKYIKTLKVSPDAFFHVSLQLAQYRTFGFLRSTYEPISMKDHRDGRTECTRPVTSEVKKLVEQFDEYEKKEDLNSILIEALSAHIERIKSCKSGHGIERHLYALEKMNELYCKDKNASIFFNDTAYKRLKTDFISTSNFGGENIKCFGFGRVVPDGYGIGYNVNNENISLTISCDVENRKYCTKLIKNIHTAFEDIAEIIKEVNEHSRR